jgi:hypothetical protein
VTVTRNHLTNPDVLHVGQKWRRRRDGTRWRVRQVWRHERRLWLESLDERHVQRVILAFADLRRKFEEVEA